MRKVKNLCVFGATGLVGRLVVQQLEKRKFPLENLVLVASDNCEGKSLPFNGRQIPVLPVSKFSFAGCELALFCVPTDVSVKYVPIAVAAGAVVIDNSSHYRTDPDVPLIIPEVNGDKISGYKNKNIITNANCAAIQLIMAVKPLHDYAKVKRIVVSSYQAVSGIGKDAIEELHAATRAFIDGKEFKPRNFAKSIAFNVIPRVDKFMQDGSTVEEWKMAHDIHKILDKDIAVSATSVRVPVEIGHSESINIEFERSITPEIARDLLGKMKGVKIIEPYITPIETVGKDEVFVSRIRQDKSRSNSLNLWAVSDNLNKGAALNTVQIAETWLEYSDSIS